MSSPDSPLTNQQTTVSIPTPDDLSPHSNLSLPVSQDHLLCALRTAADEIDSCVYIKDATGHYLFANRKVQALFGLCFADIIGKHDSDFFDLTQANSFIENDKLILAHGQSIKAEEKVLLKSGESKIFWSVKNPIRDDNGRIIGICGVSTDISEFKAVESALADHDTQFYQKRISRLFEVQKALLENPLVGVLSIRDRKIIWANQCFQKIFGYSREELVEAPVRMIYASDSEYAAVGAAYADIEQRGVIRPLQEFKHKDGQLVWMDIFGTTLCRETGETLWLSVDATARKRADDEIALSLSLLNATLNASADAILVVDLKQKWVLLNQRFIDLWQMPDEIISSQDDRAALAYILDQLDDPDSFLKKVQALYAAPESESFDTLTFKDGKVIERYSIPQRIDNRVVGRVWSFRDITAYRLTEQALRRENEKYLALLHNASDGIHIADADGFLLEVSNSFCAMLGYRREEMLGMHVSQWDAKRSATELKEFLKELRDKQARSQFETLHRHKDGRILNVEVSVFPLQLDDKPVFFASSRDISERLRFDNLLRQKERYQRALLDNFPYAVWLKDTDSRFLAVNAGFVQIFGAQHNEELIGKTDFDIAPPDLAKNYRSDDLAVMTSRQNKYVEEIIFTEGVKKCFETYKAPVVDDNGELLGTVGFARDITERRLRHQKLHLAASVFTHAREGIMITDPDANIIDVNAAFTRITGYSREEVIGKSPRILGSDLQDRSFFAAMAGELAEKGYWHGELWSRHKNGELLAEMLTISAVHNDQGELSHYVALFSDITQLKEHERRLERIAHYDALTNLPNRVLLADRLHQGMNQALRQEKPLAVVYLDLDGFKQVNDLYGHETGDLLLISVTTRMKKALRKGDTLARFGGDEFVAVLQDIGNKDACIPMLSRLLEAAARPLLINDQQLQVTASLGVTFFPQAEAVDADQLFRQADQAMYQAKLSGKNRYHLFDSEQDSNLRGHHESLNRIRQALDQNEFVLYYQPKVNMQTGEIIGAEALIRWLHPQRGLIPPAEFLPVIEEHQLAIDIGEWVIDAALKQMDIWESQGLRLSVSVNVSPKQLQQTDFVERLSAILNTHPQIDCSRLELEVLETSALEDVAQISKIIHACQKIGVSFALDDFGTGYSSLTYLKRLPVSLLKIDQSFVRNMLDDPDDLAILEGVLGLANAFSRELIAEGVETVAHGEMLLQLGCELAQGYGIAKPMPAESMPAWSVSWKTFPAWADLRAVSRDDFPILFASVEHRNWIAAIRSYLLGEIDSPPIIDHRDCRFGRWLNSSAKHQHNSRKDFKSIKKHHKELHLLATELCELKYDRFDRQAVSRLAELDEMRDGLLIQLQKLL